MAYYFYHIRRDFSTVFCPLSLLFSRAFPLAAEIAGHDFPLVQVVLDAVDLLIGLMPLSSQHDHVPRRARDRAQQMASGRSGSTWHWVSIPSRPGRISR